MEDDGINREASHDYPPPGTEESKAHYRKVAELWRKAAEDDWRGPVKVEEGWQEKARAELDQYVKEQQKRGARSSNKAAALTDQ